MKSLLVLVVGGFVVALLGTSGVTPVEALNAVGLHDVAYALDTAFGGFAKVTEVLQNANAR